MLFHVIVLVWAEYRRGNENKLYFFEEENVFTHLFKHLLFETDSECILLEGAYPRSRMYRGSSVPGDQCLHLRTSLLPPSFAPGTSLLLPQPCLVAYFSQEGNESPGTLDAGGGVVAKISGWNR